MGILSSASGITSFTFDEYNQIDIPSIYLANPDGTPLYNLGTIYDRSFELRYNTLSTFTFTAPSHINNIETDYYDYLEYRRLVYVDTIGTFMITEVEIENDGLVERKSITCQSLETVLSYKKLSLFQGTYTFDGTVTGSGIASGSTVTSKNLLAELAVYIPGWTFVTGSSVSNELRYRTRTFDITDKSLYDFLVTDVSQTYQCVFVFDSISKKIYAYDIANATTPTDIFISFDNLMKSFTISETTEELVTALTVLGSDFTNINLVNPLGNNIIYNFDYYKTADWMNQGLIDALTIWENKIDYYQPTYANMLTTLRIENEDLTSMENLLSASQTALAVMQTTLKAQIEGGLDTSATNTAIASLNSEIAFQNANIDIQEIYISSITASLVSINNELSISGSVNFTDAQKESLNNFIIGNTYTNTNFIENSLMSQTDIQNIGQELYNQGIAVLEKVSQPRYTFEIDTGNFLFIKDFEPFINQIALGCTITVELGKNVESAYTITPCLLGIDFNYDDPSQFKMILSNRLRLSDEQFQYTDIMNTSIDSGITTNFNSQKWNSASETISSIGAGLVQGINLSTINNIALYYDTSGAIIKDGGALYVEPTSFTPSLYSSGATIPTSGCGCYNIIGKNVFFELYISASAASGTTSNPLFISLPITSKAQAETNLRGSFAPVVERISVPSGNAIDYKNFVCRGVTNSGSVSLALLAQASGSPAISILASGISASAIINLSGHFMVD